MVHYLLDVQSDPRLKHTGRPRSRRVEARYTNWFLLDGSLLARCSVGPPFQAHWPPLVHEELRRDTPTGSYLMVHYLLDVQSDPRLKHTGRPRSRRVEARYTNWFLLDGSLLARCSVGPPFQAHWPPLVHEELRRDTPTGSYLMVHYLLDVQSDPRLKHTGHHSFTKS